MVAPVAPVAPAGSSGRALGDAGRAVHGPAEALAYRWGQLIGRYSRWAVRPARIRWAGREHLPPGSFIWAGWHEGNLLALAIHSHLSSRIPRPSTGGAETEALSFPGGAPPSTKSSGIPICGSFVPPGLTGATVRGWLQATGFESATLPPDGAGNPAAALKWMARRLARGGLAGVAVDGPHGPVRHVRPGALWLARLSGCPIVPTGTAARPAVLVPRWDRHVVPLPGAQVAFATAPPIHVRPGTAIDSALCDRLGAAIDGAALTARELLHR